MISDLFIFVKIIHFSNSFSLSFSDRNRSLQHAGLRPTEQPSSRGPDLQRLPRESHPLQAHLQVRSRHKRLRHVVQAEDSVLHGSGALQVATGDGGQTCALSECTGQEQFFIVWDIINYTIIHCLEHQQFDIIE